MFQIMWEIMFEYTQQRIRNVHTVAAKGAVFLVSLFAGLSIVDLL